MSVLTREELMNAIRTRVGEDTSDEVLTLFENIGDTLNDFENKANNDGEDWKKKYEENDAEWRKKYKERFFSDTNTNDDDIDDNKNKQYTFDELFEEE